jgi:hypothetical protein
MLVGSALSFAGMVHTFELDAGGMTSKLNLAKVGLKWNCGSLWWCLGFDGPCRSTPRRTFKFLSGCQWSLTNAAVACCWVVPQGDTLQLQFAMVYLSMSFLLAAFHLRDRHGGLSAGDLVQALCQCQWLRLPELET